MHEFDRKLLSPFIRRVLPKQYRCNTERKDADTQLYHQKSKNNESGTQQEATELIATNKLTENQPT